jgi:hypothetical protein
MCNDSPVQRLFPYGLCQVLCQPAQILYGIITDRYRFGEKWFFGNKRIVTPKTRSNKKAGKGVSLISSSG